MAKEIKEPKKSLAGMIVDRRRDLQRLRVENYLLYLKVLGEEITKVEKDEKRNQTDKLQS